MAYFKKGSKIIAIEQVDGFGKRPSLWVGNVGQFTKVASFRGEESAQKFVDYLRIFFGDQLVSVDEDEDNELAEGKQVPQRKGNR